MKPNDPIILSRQGNVPINEINAVYVDNIRIDSNPILKAVDFYVRKKNVIIMYTGRWNPTIEHMTFALGRIYNEAQIYFHMIQDSTPMRNNAK